MSEPLIDHFISQWKFLRSLTQDLLKTILQEELIHAPNASLGPWCKQFRHVARVQENYLNAIETGTVKFGFEDTTYQGRESKEGPQKYLQRMDDRLYALLQTEIRQPEYRLVRREIAYCKSLVEFSRSRVTASRSMDSLRPDSGQKDASQLESMGSF
jgi:hypothetical protein